MIRIMSAVAVALAVPALVGAQEKYTIKLKHGEQGDVALRTRAQTKKEAITVTGPDGNVLQEKSETIVESAKYKEEILAKKPGARADKIKRTYSEATTKTGDRVEKRIYDGQTVLIEMTGDGGYRFTIDDGKELTAAEAPELAQSFDKSKVTDEEMDKLMLPGKPVAVGDSWQVDGAKFAKVLSKDEKSAGMFHLDKAKASGKLTKAYKKDGRQYGVLEFEFAIPLKSLEGKFPCKDGSLMELKIVADACIDGTADADSATITSKFSGTAEVVENDTPTGVIVKFDISGTEKNTSTPAKK